MATLKREGGFLSSRAAKVLTLVLLAQAGIFYGMSRAEVPPQKEPLASMPSAVGSWQLLEETPLDKETLDVLKADETLSRSYVRPGLRLSAHLFVAFFKTQRSGQAPHSPKNCIPGNGWVPTVSDTVNIPISGRDPIEVNRYVIAKGESKSLVFYWYQSRDRVVASEYAAKFYVIADAMRYNRTDTALVRVVVPVVENQLEQSEEIAREFVQQIYAPVRQRLPA